MSEDQNWVVPEEGTPIAAAYALGYEAGQLAQRETAAESWTEVRVEFTYGRNTAITTGHVWPGGDLSVAVADMKARFERDSMGYVEVTKVETREVVCTMWEER